MMNSCISLDNILLRGWMLCYAALAGFSEVVASPDQLGLDNARLHTLA